MDDSRTDIDTRLRHLEQGSVELAANISSLARDTADIKMSIRALGEERPVNIPAWIASGSTVLTLFGALIYGAFVAPLNSKVEDVGDMLRQHDVVHDQIAQRFNNNKDIMLRVLEITEDLAAAEMDIIEEATK